MAYILNIESATDICSVCISQNGQLLAIQEIMGNDHASSITLLIDECLRIAHISISDLSAVAISNGPGSYTSLRVGVSTAKGLGYALGIPLIAVDTLESLALAAYQQQHDDEAIYCPMIDARRMEVYTASYHIADNKTVLDTPVEPWVIDAAFFKRFEPTGKRLVLSGNGSGKCATVTSSDLLIFTNILCSAQHLVPLSTHCFNIKKFIDIAYHTPEYLKPPNITTSKKKL